MRIALRLAVLLVTIHFHLTVGAAAEMRTWTSANGKSHVDAELVAVEGDQVKLKNAAGRVVTIPLAKLTAEDQAYAKKQAVKMKAPKPDAVPSDTVEPIVVPPRPEENAEEKPRTGSFKIVEEEEGVSAMTYLNLTKAFGGKPFPEAERKILNGTSKWMTNSDSSSCNWSVYVPKGYDSKTPFGLFVYISAGASGNVRGGFQPVLDKHRLIWIGANQSGNKQQTAMRHGLALRAFEEIKKRYRIDPERTYVSGFSGGGRVSSQVMIMNCDIFRGGMPMCGCNPYRIMHMPDGTFFTPVVKHLDPRAKEYAKKHSRFVFITGENDMNRDQTRAVANQYRSDGFRSVAYLETPGGGHGTNAEWFEKGIMTLDGPILEATQKALTRMKKKTPLGTALKVYSQAVAYGIGEPENGAPENGDPENDDSQASAKAKLAELRTTYDEHVVALEGVFVQGDVRVARKALSQFRKTWGDQAHDAQRFSQAIKDHIKRKKEAKKRKKKANSTSPIKNK